MYLKQSKYANGEIFLSIMEKFRDKDGKVRERTYKSIGYLKDLEKQYEDPIAHFKQVAAEATVIEKNNRTEKISIDMSEVMEPGTDDVKNVGYGILKELYKELQIDKFWNWKTRGGKAEYSVDQIFRLLVFSRALFPASKRATLNISDTYFEPFEEVTLDDVYHCLDIIARNKDALQKWIFEKTQNIFKHNMSVTYFDCTNYYFDIGTPDIDVPGEAVKYRKRGPEKNHRPDPIVEMGLLLDGNGFPIAYDLFPGNESEKIHMRPIIKRVKEEYTDNRIIIVADRGLNTSDNIYWINGDNKGKKNQRDGYVYGQSVRGASDEFKKWLLEQDGYKTDHFNNDNGEIIAFKHKSRITPRKINVNVTRKDGTKGKKNVTIDQKQMVYYSEKYAKKQKTDRDIMVARAKDLIAHPKKYDRVTCAGSAAYICNIAFDKNTGEVVDGRNLYIDTEKILEEEKCDGYYSIVTSELNLTDIELRNIYRGLNRIEDTFKVTKTFFKARPVYVWLNEHIDAHFAVCFVTLVLIRLLEMKLGEKYPVGQIINSLIKYNCVNIQTNLWKFVYYDDILKSCGEALHMDLDKSYRRTKDVQRLLKY